MFCISYIVVLLRVLNATLTCKFIVDELPWASSVHQYECAIFEIIYRGNALHRASYSRYCGELPTFISSMFQHGIAWVVYLQQSYNLRDWRSFMFDMCWHMHESQRRTVHLREICCFLKKTFKLTAILHSSFNHFKCCISPEGAKFNRGDFTINI